MGNSVYWLNRRRSRTCSMMTQPELSCINCSHYSGTLFDNTHFISNKSKEQAQPVEIINIIT